MDLATLQREQVPWVKHNFGDRPKWQPAAGIMEEAGELAHAILKKAQGIRVGEDHDAKIKDALADILIFVCDLGSAEGLDFKDVWPGPLCDSDRPGLDEPGAYDSYRLALSIGVKVGHVVDAHLEWGRRYFRMARLRWNMIELIAAVRDFARNEGIDIDAVLAETWKEVKARDWKKDPAKAGQ